jgi:TnpA family transposase
MSRLTILSDNEQVEFDYPPVLTVEKRALCFAINNETEQKIDLLRTPINKVGFLLQYGYFRACKRFFVANRFRYEDVEYAARLLGLSAADVNLSGYKNRTHTNHQKVILELTEHKRFEEMSSFVEKEIVRQIEQFTDPHQLFFDLLQFLYDHNIEIPTSHKLSDLITQHYLSYEEKLLDIIEKKVTKRIIAKLDKLTSAETSGSRGMLGSMKIINQSKKPKAIQASLDTFKKVEELFNLCQPVIKALNLPSKSCIYYATWVQKSKLSQLKQFPDKNKLYLHLIAFIQHQYYLRQDTFVDIFLKCVQSCKNIVVAHLKEADQVSRPDKKAAVRYVLNASQNSKKLIDEITEVTRSTLLTDSGKVQKISELLEEYESQKNEIKRKKLEMYEKSLDDLAKDKNYYDILNNLSVKLQLRISGILKALVFNEDNSDKTLLKAIKHFVDKDGEVTSTAPKGFLKDEEKEALCDDKGKFRVPLYKMLLFIYVANEIKSGELNLKYSYKYLAIQDYLYSEKEWLEKRDELLKAAGLEKFSDYRIIMAELKQELHEKYRTVNERFIGNRNPYLSIDKEGYVHVITPALPDKDSGYINAILGQVNYIPILQVLNDINEITHFTQGFKHHSIKNVKRRPRATTIIAGIIGLGCNIGATKMAQISNGVNQNTLLNAINWYFSKGTLHEANERIVTMINKLALSSIFVDDLNQRHGSSDGSKYGVSVESLLAANSFKYFGQGVGVSVYTFIDECQALFHSLVMSSSEREAAHVLDGLNNINSPKIDIHSTDTHGYREAIFAASHFMFVAFAPRIKNLKKQYIYAFSSKQTFERKGYKILPSRTINQKLIANHWEDILRFMVTLKLKKTSASQLFKRLSSYARNSPLYKAIKEFGRIIKSIFILTYFDDVRLRQRIEKQLNRIELSNKFGRAVFYANNGEFKQAGSDEQETIIACRTLIQNSIVLWNYLYLSQLLSNCANEKERNGMVNMIKEGSVISWAHVNLHGEFDFSRRAANDIQFDMPRILSLQVG